MTKPFPLISLRIGAAGSLPPLLLYGTCLLGLLAASAAASTVLARPSALRATQAAGAPTTQATGDQAARFDRARLVEIARSLANEEYRAPEMIGGWLAELDYDEYRRIRHRPEARLWREGAGGFEMSLLHVGGLFRMPIEIALLDEGNAKPVEFVRERFDYDGLLQDGRELSGIGHSGFRLHTAQLGRSEPREFLVFQGASYFRGVPRGLRYGVSARGLSIRTGSPEGEEFPNFRRFWVERPTAPALHVRVHALLDSPSVTGAYTFTVSPGAETVLDVEVVLFARREVAAFGIAPLTSMFMFSAHSQRQFDDPRTGVHDSDGLQMINGAGDRLWRPLVNPRALEMSAFVDENPVGFGLAQRRRDFDDYSDLEARYELRPSAWVEPLGHWGQGSVVLVEIPTQAEYHDNIVAFWQPAAPLQKGTPRRFAYRLHFAAEVSDPRVLYRVEASRSGKSLRGEQRLLIVDFAHPEHTRGPAGITLHAECSAGTIEERRLERLPSGGFRATLVFAPGDAKQAEFRLHLRNGDEPCSEVWLHRWNR